MSVLREIRSRLDAIKASHVEPCVPTTASSPPAGAGWIHEIKHDGYRMMVRRNGPDISLLTRNGHDWSQRYPLIVKAANALKARSFLIDGEAVAVDFETGLAIFEQLRKRRRNPNVFLYAFDLLEWNGKDLRREPIEARKAALAKLIKPQHHGIRLCDHLGFHDGALVFAHACELGCEGIVSKRLGSRYGAGRTRDWIKTKNPNAPAVKRESEEDWGKRGQ